MTQKNILLRPMTRRQVLIAGGAAATVAALSAGWTVSLYEDAFFDDLQVTLYRFATPKWPADMPSLKIAFLSDLHVGCRSVNLDTVDKIVAQTNALEPDLILLGGDYLTGKIKKMYREYIEPAPIAEKLAGLKAKLGVYSVLGNHDWSNDGDKMWQALESVGITVLENNSVFIPYGKKGFHIVGLADYLTRYPLYKETVGDITDGLPQIVLSHDPYTFKDMPDAPVIQLSGHTHGGQMKFPIVGAVINPTPGAPLKWLYGMIDENNRHMIITSGIGTSILPLKNTPSELVLLTIDPSTTLAS